MGDQAPRADVILHGGAILAEILEALPNGELHIPAIEGIGGSYLYLVDQLGHQILYGSTFEPVVGAAREADNVGLHTLDHLTHNVNRGRMDHWAQFYERVFNFRQIRYFDIAGKHTGLHSRAMTSPDR